MRRIASLLLPALLAVPLPAGAQPAPAVQREINGLMGELANSRCEFFRNGKWYGAAKAHDHLQGKYDYLRKRGLVDSAEQFIDRAASRSSLSGIAYRVRCPGKPEQEAAAWFGEALQRLRRSAAPAG